MTTPRYNIYFKQYRAIEAAERSGTVVAIKLADGSKRKPDHIPLEDLYNLEHIVLENRGAERRTTMITKEMPATRPDAKGHHFINSACV